MTPPPLIYLLDSDENFGMKTACILSSLAKEYGTFVSSVITCTEYLVVPYRTNNLPSIEAFWALMNDCSIVIHPITKEVAEKAAKIRAEYKFKTMDSLQLAVASIEKCDVFLTNDKQLKQFRDVPCVTIGEWDI